MWQILLTHYRVKDCCWRILCSLFTIERSLLWFFSFMISGVIISLPTYSLSYDARFQDLTETHIEWLPIVRLSWLPFRWREQEVILNYLGCRLSCKNKSIKRKSCFEEQTPFCGLLLVSILNSCLESCAYLHFLSVLSKTFVNIRVLVSSTDRLVAFRARVRLFKKGL